MDRRRSGGRRRAAAALASAGAAAILLSLISWPAVAAAAGEPANLSVPDFKAALDKAIVTAPAEELYEGESGLSAAALQVSNPASQLLYRSMDRLVGLLHHVFLGMRLSGQASLTRPSGETIEMHIQSKDYANLEIYVEMVRFSLVLARASAWTQAYALDKDGFVSRDPVELPDAVPRAPHLQDCGPLVTWREREDSRPLGEGADGGPAGDPEWLVASCDPAPPWVRGHDSDNLAGTRAAQAYMWWLQHPRDCADPSLCFLYVSWPSLSRKDRAGARGCPWSALGSRVWQWVCGSADEGNALMRTATGGAGVGAQLHFIADRYSYAIAKGRIMVFQNNYLRGGHTGCEAHGKELSFECYFLPEAAPACKARIAKLWEAQGAQGGEDDVVMGEPTREQVGTTHWAYRSDTSAFCAKWGCPDGWMKPSDEVLGRMKVHPLDWFRAQQIRYLLRYPSEYLCRVTNQARHASYGKWVAHRHLEATLAQRFLLSMGDPGLSSNFTGDLEGGLWAERDEVLAPRPYISLHVREGAKGREMTLFPFRAYMEEAERVRRSDPNMRTVWLATMLTSVVEEGFFKFFFTKQRRLQGEEENGDFDDIPLPTTEGMSKDEVKKLVRANLRESVDMSFANLMVQAEADYFIGTLGSNWDRLIDELRKTNGRLSAGYIALNWYQLDVAGDGAHVELAQRDLAAEAVLLGRPGSLTTRLVAGAFQRQLLGRHGCRAIRWACSWSLATTHVAWRRWQV
eukprot:SM000257S08642  [mRNA]  locus=s257:148927:154746:- [translate_table: standard]